MEKTVTAKADVIAWLKRSFEAVRQAYYDRIAKHDMRPLWKVMDSLVTDEPVSRCQPAIWHFDDVKTLVMESGNLISAEEAKRRLTEAEVTTVVLALRDGSEFRQEITQAEFDQIKAKALAA